MLCCSAGLPSRPFTEYEASLEIANAAASVGRLLSASLVVIVPAWFPRRQARNSLLRPQLAVKNCLQFRKSPPQLPGIQKVRRIPRFAGEVQLRFRVCLKQQHSSGTQSPANLRKQRALQIANAQNERITVHR